jgi:hypothetical protein
MNRNAHILNAASNLLGIALLIVTGIKLTNHSSQSFADETGLAAALLLAVSCLLSYLSIRQVDNGERLEVAADKVFLLGLAALFVAVLILAFGLG